jgi:hypothetical protein
MKNQKKISSYAELEKGLRRRSAGSKRKRQKTSTKEK